MWLALEPESLSASLLLQNCPSCFPQPTWLHILWLLPVHTTHSMPPTHPALGTKGPCQPGFGAQGSLGCQFKGFCFAARCPQECSSAPVAAVVSASPQRPRSSCSLPVVLGSRLAEDGGAPLPLASPLHIMSQPHAPGVC